MTNPIDLGRVGIWSRQLRFGDTETALASVTELEELGYGALWIPGAVGGDILECVESVLGATRRSIVATGILNIWSHPAEHVAATHSRLDAKFAGRFLLGLGVSHATLIDADCPGRYRRPLARMREYLKALESYEADAQRLPRCLAALAPKMVALAGSRTLGTHPYMVPVEHTWRVRDILGAGALVAPELSVILESDGTKAREVARADLDLYLGFPNYTRVWLSLGFEEEDLAAGGSRRLVDALYAYGSPEQIRSRIDEHHAAGADHVCIRVITDHPDDAVRIPMCEWHELAKAVLS